MPNETAAFNLRTAYAVRNEERLALIAALNLTPLSVVRDGTAETTTYHLPASVTDGNGAHTLQITVYPDRTWAVAIVVPWADGTPAWVSRIRALAHAADEFATVY